MATSSKKIQLSYPKITVSEPIFIKGDKSSMFSSKDVYEIRIGNSSLEFPTKKEADAIYNEIKNFKNEKQYLEFFQSYLLRRIPQRAYITNTHKETWEDFSAPKVGQYLTILNFYKVKRGTYFKFEHDNFGKKRMTEFVFDSTINDRVLGWIKIGDDWNYGDPLYNYENKICAFSGAEILIVKEMIAPPNKFELPNLNEAPKLSKKVEDDLYKLWDFVKNRKKKSDRILEIEQQYEDIKPFLSKLTIDNVPTKIQALVLIDAKANRRKKVVSKEQVEKTIQKIWNDYYTGKDTFAYGGYTKKMYDGGDFESPRIYIVNLEAYNNNTDEGEWLDFSDYKNADELMDAIQNLLDGWGVEEYEIQDAEYLPTPMGMDLAYLTKVNFEEIYTLMDVAKEKGISIDDAYEEMYGENESFADGGSLNKTKLFTKEDDQKLFNQHKFDKDLTKQDVIIDLYQSVGNIHYYIINADPKDPDNLLAIIKNDISGEIEVDFVSRGVIERFAERVGGTRRSFDITPINANKLYNFLSDSYYADGGGVGRFSEYSKDALNDMRINLSRYENTESDIEMVKDELKKREGQNEKDSAFLTKEQIKMWNDYVRTGKINGKKENNMFAVARHIGTSVAKINAYGIEQRKKGRKFEFGGDFQAGVYADGGEVYNNSKYLTKEQWEKWNDYVNTGKINGKKEDNIFTVARHIGTSVAKINSYEIEQRQKRRKFEFGGDFQAGVYAGGGAVNWQKYPTKKVRGLYEIKGDGINRKVNIVFFERYDDDLYSLYPLDKDKHLFREIMVKSTALNSLNKGVSVQGETNDGKKVSIKRLSNQDFSYARGGGVDDKKKYEIIFEDVFSFATTKKEAEMTNSQYQKALQQKDNKVIVVDFYNKSQGIREQLRIKHIKPKYAKGGSLQAHGIKEGDIFMKTISGNIQKVKDKNGKIVYVDLSTGERDAQPPLPFEMGGYTDLSKSKPTVINESKSRKYDVEVPEIDIEKIKTIDLDIDNNKIRSIDDSVRVLKQIYDKGSINAYEESKILFLDNSNKVIGIYNHSKGGITGTVIDIEMVCALAVKCLAKGVIMSHNHPSGSLKFSDADVQTTRELKNALNLFKIALLDSIILTDNGFLSMASEGILANGGHLNRFENGGGVDEEVTYFINKDGIKVRSKVEPKRKLSEAEWMAKHNESKEARTYAFGGLFSMNMNRPKPIDLNQEQVRLKSGEYVQVLNYQGDSLMVMEFSKLGTGASPKYVRLSDVDMTSLANGGALIGNQKRIDMNKNGKIDAEDFEIMRNTMDGAWRKDRKYVNSTSRKNGKLVDYEVQYARKNNPSRKGYKGKRNFATGGGVGKKDDLYFKPIILQSEYPNFLTVIIKYPIGEGFLTALGQRTRSGQDRDNGQIKANEISKSIVAKLNKEFNIEDIDVSDNKNGKIVIFAVSDDFVSLPKNTIEQKLKTNSFANGGGISKFERLSRSVAKNYEGKRVKPQYQKEYGKVYSKAEAKEVGNKVAGKVKANQKMTTGGETKKGARGGVMVLAKKIRKEGESWKDALKRAGQQLK